MHACLHISEIVQNIVEHADGGLVSLALACRAFYEPAMNVIWSDLPGLRPLLQCFPRAVTGATLFWNSQMKRYPVPAERRRFEHHAPRVRRLTVSFVEVELGASEGWLLALAEIYAQSAAFPNLRSLTVNGGRQVESGYSLFAQSPLEELVIYSDDEDDYLNIAMLILAVSSTLLRLRWSWESEPSGLAIENLDLDTAVRSCPNMQKLHVFIPYSSATISHLARLSTLVSLTIHVDELDYADLLSGIPWPFPKLLHLKVFHGTERLPSLLSLFQIAPPLQLESLEIYFPGRWIDEQTVAESVTAIFPAIQGFSCLRRLSVGAAYHEIRLWIDVHSVHGSVLQPILQMHSLEVLDLADIPMQLSTIELTDIASAFPRLQRLRLGSNAQWNPHTSIWDRFGHDRRLAIEDLLCFSRYCPELQELAISNDFLPADPSLQRRDASLLAASNLRELCLGMSHIAEAKGVAAFCAEVYPLAQVTSNIRARDDDAEEWAKVIDTIDSMKNRLAVSRMLEERIAASRRTHRSVAVQAQPDYVSEG
ncbi:hypothetical protein PsYK624_150330 [Phanerochaete sordida]|uniref:F-box domain-containing protein n=1 Tax=Phanerochaete sordida TaxID=48140 RepID=A0A9P3GPI5_9APHY|nr:hypothetical protein PsYK624_150330 [Phanerochaete sordida]